jgi:integrase
VLRTIRDNIGLGTAKHARVILSGIMGVATRHDAIETNPVREVSRFTTNKKRDRKRDAMIVTSDDLPRLRAHLRTSEKAVTHDLVDLVDMLSACGCRIGELLALTWDKIELDTGAVKIEGTVIRERGVGLYVQPHTKSAAGMRTIRLPDWAVEILRKRAKDAIGEWVFPSTVGTLRDPDNTRKALRAAVADSEWAGLHPHAFRHLVATRLDEAGLSARDIADYLGHERVSMTQDVYMNRKTGGSQAASALNDLAPE